MKDDNFFPKVVLFVIGSYAMGIFIGLLVAGHFANKALTTECESTLTRNEHCVLIAVPEQEIAE